MLRACLYGLPLRTFSRLPASRVLRAFAAKAAKSPKASKRGPTSDDPADAEPAPAPVLAVSAPRSGGVSPPATMPTAAPAMSAGKRQALETAFKQIEMSYGKGSVMKLGARHTQQMALNIPVIPTGSLLWSRFRNLYISCCTGRNPMTNKAPMVHQTVPRYAYLHNARAPHATGMIKFSCLDHFGRTIRFNCFGCRAGYWWGTERTRRGGVWSRVVW